MTSEKLTELKNELTRAYDPDAASRYWAVAAAMCDEVERLNRLIAELKRQTEKQ